MSARNDILLSLYNDLNGVIAALRATLDGDLVADAATMDAINRIGAVASLLLAIRREPKGGSRHQ